MLEFPTTMAECHYSAGMWQVVWKLCVCTGGAEETAASIFCSLKTGVASSSETLIPVYQKTGATSQNTVIF
jgi:hypothetical protein